MKIVVKRKEGSRWISVELSKMVGKSILDFMLESEDELVAALHDDDEKAIAFVSNNEKYVSMYKDRGLSISADNLKILMGTQVTAPAGIEIFEGATLASIKVL